MQRITIWLLLVSLHTTFLHAGVNFQEISLAAARAQANQTDKLFFLHFTADWCMPCRWMEDHTFQDQALANYANAHFLAVKVAFDQSANQALKAQFKVDKLPTILVFSAAGVLLDRQETSLEAPELLAWLQSYNTPAHHLSPMVSTPVATAAEEHIMASPQPSWSFYRAPLIPDEEPTLAKDDYVMAAVDQQLVLTPRSPGQQTYIVSVEGTTNYSQAVRTAQIYEKKYGQSAELMVQRQGNTTHYRIALGKFSSKSAATSFLHYLNRNDIIGTIILVE